MRTVGSYEAKTHLPRLLDEVARGETITITKKGKPVARLTPVEDLEERRRRADEAWQQWKRYRDEHNISLGPGLSFKEFMREARRHPIDRYMGRLFDEMDERDRRAGDSND